jgi:hypothetical protein
LRKRLRNLLIALNIGLVAVWIVTGSVKAKLKSTPAGKGG